MINLEESRTQAARELADILPRIKNDPVDWERHQISLEQFPGEGIVSHGAFTRSTKRFLSRYRSASSAFNCSFSLDDFSKVRLNFGNDESVGGVPEWSG